MKKIMCVICVLAFVSLGAVNVNVALKNEKNALASSSAVNEGAVNVTSSGVLVSTGSNQVNVTQNGINIGNEYNILPSSSYNVYLTNIGKTGGLYIRNSPTVGAQSNGLFVEQSILSNSENVAITGKAYSATPITGYSRGMEAYAGNSILNFGVYTELCGTYGDGAALYAAQTTGGYNGVWGNYAGYFNGRAYISQRLGIGYSEPSYTLDVNGNIRCTTLTQTSDARGKDNISDLRNTSERIGKLRPVTYTLKPEDLSAYYQILKNSGATVAINNDSDLRRYFALDEESDDKRKHIGFIAQELKEVFPELVYEDKKGRLSVDYVSLVPVLVETIQQLNKTVQEQNKRLEALEKNYR